jgi:RNA polymerase sigma-70 factor (ECF subfamily)
MAKCYDRTAMGGQKSVFQLTRWSEILGAKTNDESRRRLVVDCLLSKYWKPVYCYLRRKGYDNESAKDLTQGFFCEIVLGRELIQQADRTKGRFRTFLLTALDHYVTSEYRKESAKKRSPMDPLLSLEAADMPQLPAEQGHGNPEQIFSYAWVAELLDEVLAKVRRQYCDAGKETHWQVFRARVLVPAMERSEPPPLARICEEYGVESESVASNMIVTVKRRFRAILRGSLRRSVQSDAEVETELDELLRVLAKGGAR